MATDNDDKKILMKKTARAIMIIAVPLSMAACGDNFEWFPSVTDTTPPTVTATISNNSIFDNRTTHVPTLPANVIFSASEAATIYYTTNGNDPSTTSSSVDISTGSGVTGPSISITNTILKFFGVDKSSSKNSSAIQKATILSP